MKMSDTTWSPEQMVARLGGDEALARQLVSLFIVECPRMIDAVRDSVANGSADDIRRAAHALKGSVSNFTSDGATATAYELENIGRESRLVEAPAMLARLEQELAALLDALGSW
jgi:HPt (histidine-containing phosphotransfer) domain-containing protein